MLAGLRKSSGVMALLILGSVCGWASDGKEPLRSEAAELRAQATAVTLEISRLTADGKVLQEDGAVQALRELVDQLEEINQRLARLEERLKEAEGATEGMREAYPVMNQELKEVRRFRPSFYSQLQYRDSNRQIGSAISLPTQVGVGFSGAREAAFSLRRVRFGGTYVIDAQTSFRMSIEAASGAGQDQLQLRDARVTHTLRRGERGPNTEIWAGQFNLPLGYENARSSADREFPEHAQYNRMLLAGEAFRGVLLSAPVGENLVGRAGVFSSLSQNDPEQVGRGSMPNGRAAAFASLRFETKQAEFGVAHLQGERPEFRSAGTTGTATVGTSTVVTAPRPLSAPAVDRRLTYLDGTWVGFLDPSITLRGEVMWGRDRLPIASTTNAQTSGDEARVSAKDMSGWHVQLNWNARKFLQVFGRLESFDPNLDASGDAVSGWGLGLRQFWGTGSSLTLTYERFRVAQFAERREHGVTTLRYQVRF